MFYRFCQNYMKKACSTKAFYQKKQCVFRKNHSIQLCLLECQKNGRTSDSVKVFGAFLADLLKASGSLSFGKQTACLVSYSCINLKLSYTRKCKKVYKKCKNV